MLSIAQPPSIVIHHGHVWSAPAPATALAIAQDRIQATGSDVAMLALAGPATRVIDAGGGLVLPGFHDAHVHFLNGARNLRNLELSAETTLDGILRRIEEFAGAHPQRDWLTGRGWFYAVFPGGLPDRSQLDRAVADRPVAIEAYDGHTTWVNSSALQRLGITAATPDPPRGEICRNAAGEPTGVLKEGAMELVDRRLPAPTRDEDLASLREAMSLAFRQGINSVQEAGAGIEQYAIYDALADAGRPRVRIRLGQQMEPGLPLREWERRLTEWESVAFPRRADPFVAGGIVKAYADGVIESGTAAMLEPYEGMAWDQPGALGRPQWEQGELGSAVRVADARGWQVQIHAIGDRAVRIALDAYEGAAALNGPRERRHRIEHIETVHPRDVTRFGKLGVVASMQPYHADPEPAQLDLFTARIGAARAGRGWAWGSILRAGGRVAFGSDWPIVSFDPRLGLNSAVNRTTRDGRPPGGWLPTERLSLDQALAGYTSGAAYAGWQDGQRGTLRPGMLADIVILDRDFFTAPEAIMKASVSATIVGGLLAYERNSDTSD
jgi:predicted amidohydrolase YtcJ